MTIMSPVLLLCLVLFSTYFYCTFFYIHILILAGDTCVRVSRQIDERERGEGIPVPRYKFYIVVLHM